MVSIIIPVFNGKQLIESTINSVLSQTYLDYELIIIDDCSIDGSFSYVEEVFGKNKNIRLYKNDENVGLIKTLNRGIGLSKGEFILPLGQDDVLVPNHLAMMVSQFQNPEVVASYCDERIIDDKGKFLSEIISKPLIIKTKDLIGSNKVYSCGIVLRKKALIQVGCYPVFPEYPQYGEWYLWILLSEIGKIEKCEGLVSYYRRHATNLTNLFDSPGHYLSAEKYWRKCRRLAVKSKKVSFIDKVKGYVFIFKRKIYIFFYKVRNRKKAA